MSSGSVGCQAPDRVADLVMVEHALEPLDLFGQELGHEVCDVGVVDSWHHLVTPRPGARHHRFPFMAAMWQVMTGDTSIRTSMPASTCPTSAAAKKISALTPMPQPAAS